MTRAANGLTARGHAIAREKLQAIARGSGGHNAVSTMGRPSRSPVHGMHPPGLMKALLMSMGLLAASACSHHPSPGPASPEGLTEAQAAATQELPAEFPRQVEPPRGAYLATATPTALGTERLYASRLPYDDAVRFFDRTLPEEGCQTIRRSSTRTSTVWAVQCSTGDRVHVSVRQTVPTTVQVIEPLEP
jgi:hypothetical protein